MTSHMRDAFSSSQNVGNALGDRPCVRQSELYRRHLHGDAMRDVFGIAAPAPPRPQTAPGAEAAAPWAASRRGSAAGAAASPRPPAAERPPTAPVQAYSAAEDVGAPAMGGSHAPALAWAEDCGGAPGVAAPGGYLAAPPRDSPAPGRGRGRGRGVAAAAAPPLPPDAMLAGIEGTAVGSRAPPAVASPCPAGGTPGARRRGHSASGAATRAAGWNSSPRPCRDAAPPRAQPSRPSHTASPARGREVVITEADLVAPSPNLRASSTPGPRISQARFDNMRVAPAFESSGSRFMEEYSRGALPCRINHGTASNRISWDRTEEEVRARREELLVLSADGLRELRHPYSTIARLAFADLAGLDGCPPLSDQALRGIVASMRLALQAEPHPPPRSAPSPKRGLGAQRDRGVFEAALAALLLLGRAEGPGLVPYLHVVIPPIGKRLLLRGHREPVLDVLRELASACGPESEAVMRSRGVVL